jgi:hypothetical protein
VSITSLFMMELKEECHSYTDVVLLLTIYCLVYWSTHLATRIRHCNGGRHEQSELIQMPGVPHKMAVLAAVSVALLLGRPVWPSSQKNITHFPALWRWDS